MPAALTIEERLTILEKDLAELKKVTAPIQPKESWIDKVAGSFHGDPEFGEILRLGREIRKADRMGDADGEV